MSFFFRLGALHWQRWVGLGLLAALLASPVVYAAPKIAPSPEIILKENVNYRVVITDETPPSDGRILVQEMFWYGCPHCFHLEPVLDEWRKTLPAYVDFEPYAVPLTPGWVPLTKAFYTAKFMGVLPKTHVSVFTDIHVKNLRPVTREQIADMYADLGVNRDQFLQMYDSFGVDNAVRQAGVVAQDAGVTGVPAILVNGKYLVTGDMAGSNEAMLPIVDALIAKIEAQRKAKS
ncbi:thiol:disulfide interchange protein DsbA/DsbL [Halothiobacillus sp.]|uniref:thiol:disulfide interchange protein DsbA/DsbL n=1 Tax=Halothiobacillus sp. TaxID=1891311 RepID=UPI00260A1E41|nr:thiol:disulfide interchange protein DsbA/DsbL [Halothiobacillus sp.]